MNPEVSEPRKCEYCNGTGLLFPHIKGSKSPSCPACARTGIAHDPLPTNTSEPEILKPIPEIGAWCLACGHPTLYLEDGLITCAYIDCDDPSYTHERLVALAEENWTATQALSSAKGSGSDTEPLPSVPKSEIEAIQIRDYLDHYDEGMLKPKEFVERIKALIDKAFQEGYQSGLHEK